MRFRRQSQCCPQYRATPCLYPNEEQIVEGDDIETVIIAGTLYTSSVTAANCIALELAEAEHFTEVCELEPTIGCIPWTGCGEEFTDCLECDQETGDETQYIINGFLSTLLTIECPS
jgi:hypothetical protein